MFGDEDEPRTRFSLPRSGEREETIASLETTTTRIPPLLDPGCFHCSS
jgi:hypothetical protein